MDEWRSVRSGHCDSEFGVTAEFPSTLRSLVDSIEERVEPSAERYKSDELAMGASSFAKVATGSSNGSKTTSVRYLIFIPLSSLTDERHSSQHALLDTSPRDLWLLRGWTHPRDRILCSS